MSETISHVSVESVQHCIVSWVQSLRSIQLFAAFVETPPASVIQEQILTPNDCHVHQEVRCYLLNGST